MDPTQPFLRRRNQSMFALLLLAVGLLLGGCTDYPRDPERTTERVESGVMRVGVIHDPPFVRLRAPGDPRGPEVELARALAQSLDARVAWFAGGQDQLLEDLEHFRLDLVVGGLSPQSPWQGRVALTRPFQTRDEHGRLVPRVAAVPPGENRWQLQVEHFSRGEVGRALLERVILERTADPMPAANPRDEPDSTATGEVTR